MCCVLQSATDCSGPVAYRFYPAESVSNCTQSNVFVANDQLQLNLWIAANCSTQPKHASNDNMLQTANKRNKDGGGNMQKNSILTMLNADW